MKTFRRLILIGSLAVTGCTSGIVNPWLGYWHTDDDRVLRFRDDGKVEYFARGEKFAGGTYQRMSSNYARLDLKAINPPRNNQRSERMQVVKLSDSRTFEFNRLTFKRGRYR